MPPDRDAAFECFASAFVVAYWSAVKDGAFPIPPDEPVEESLEELLSAVSYTTDGKGQEYTLRTTRDQGDWWMFGFRPHGGAWNLLRASARSGKNNPAHNLLGVVYEPYFRPLLEYATTRANKDTEVSGATGGQRSTKP